MLKALAAAIFLVISGIFAAGQGTVPVSYRLSPTAPQIFPLTELKEGMRGTASTVFSGTKSDEFNVEILGVIPNWIGPKQDMIVGRISGGQADRTFVFAGMSGSPVYINGRLVGAISYSFPFAKEPICGITPIEQMISTTVTARPSEGQRVARTFSYSQFMTPAVLSGSDAPAKAVMYSSGFAQSGLLNLTGYSAMPIATPIAVSGVSQSVLEMLAPAFARGHTVLVPGAAGNTGIMPMKKFNETTLLGGDSIVVHLARGDIQIAAAGTVTLRDGDKIYAFGHPFFSLGSTSLPMSESHVITVVPNANNSFKLAVPDSTVGSLTQDRATGIYGRLGDEPRMIPVHVRLKTSRGLIEESNFESAIDETFSSLIINAGIANILAAHERGIGEETIELNTVIKVKGQEPIRLQRRYGGLQAAALAAASPAIAIGSLLHANFDGLEITGVDLDVSARDGSSTAAIDRLSLDRTQVRAGETVEAIAFIRSESGVVTPEKVSITVPKDVAPGMLSLTIADGSTIQQNSPFGQFSPRNTADMIATLNKLKRPDRLYAVLTRTTSGAIIGSSEMPNLPPSVMATINNDRTVGGSRNAVQTVLSETMLPESPWIASGSQTLQIEVIR